jgi:small-conductance mechanosensitive channel
MNLLHDTPLGEVLWSPWILGPSVFVLWMVTFYIVKAAVVRTLRRVSPRATGGWRDDLIAAMSLPLLIAVASGGLVIFGRILPLPPEGDKAFDVMFAAALVLALILFVDRLCRKILVRYSEKIPVLVGIRGLIQGIVRSLIIGLGLLVFLDSIGISITPFLASLGIGSLAVALALKDTLANLFSGIQIIADRPIEPGHFVKLEGGQEGTVTRVGWRSTWIRMTGNSIAVVPNSRLAESVIINHSLPELDTEIPVDLAVHQDSDLEQVERVALEVARGALAAEGAKGAEPKVRFHAFADSGIGLRVILRAASFEDGTKLRHHFIMRLHRRFREEGIVIPYPTRTLDLPPAPEEPARKMERAYGDESPRGGDSN